VCHSVDGSASIGPTWFQKYGKHEDTEDGKKLLVDDNFIRESIEYPNSKKIKGYAPVMPSFSGQLNDNQIAALIEYFKSLK